MNKFKIPIPTIGSMKTPITTQQLAALAMQQERSVCPKCGCGRFVSAKELHVVPPFHPVNPTPGRPVYVMTNERAYCMSCGEQLVPMDAVKESEYVRSDNA